MIWFCKTSFRLASGYMKDLKFELRGKIYKHVASAMVIHVVTSSRPVGLFLLKTVSASVFKCQMSASVFKCQILCQILGFAIQFVYLYIVRLHDRRRIIRVIHSCFQE